MERRTNFPSITVKQAFVQFLEGSSFARQTRESYAEDLRPLLTQVGQAPISALTDDVVRSYLRTQEALAPAMSNRHLAVFRSFSSFLSGRGWLTQAILEGVERKSEGTPATRAPNPLTYEVAIPTQRKLLRRRAKLKLSMQLREFPRANGPNLHESLSYPDYAGKMRQGEHMLKERRLILKIVPKFGSPLNLVLLAC